MTFTTALQIVSDYMRERHPELPRFEPDNTNFWGQAYWGEPLGNSFSVIDNIHHGLIFSKTILYMEMSVQVMTFPMPDTKEKFLQLMQILDHA